MSQKLLIIVLVALVVIFVITIGIGGCHGGGNRKTDDESSVGALKGLQGKRFVKIGDKATANPPACAPAGSPTWTFNGVCVITFGKRSFISRSTRVVFVPTNAMVPVRAIVDPKNGPRQDELVKAGECFATAIDHAGGTMTLIGNATLTLLHQACPE